jgi:hypothetical protein
MTVLQPSNVEGCTTTAAAHQVSEIRLIQHAQNCDAVMDAGACNGLQYSRGGFIISISRICGQTCHDYRNSDAIHPQQPDGFHASSVRVFQSIQSQSVFYVCFGDRGDPSIGRAYPNSSAYIVTGWSYASIWDRQDRAIRAAKLEGATNSSRRRPALVLTQEATSSTIYD